jgi:hypothetical protein
VGFHTYNEQVEDAGILVSRLIEAMRSPLLPLYSFFLLKVPVLYLLFVFVADGASNGAFLE